MSALGFVMFGLIVYLVGLTTLLLGYLWIESLPTRPSDKFLLAVSTVGGIAGLALLTLAYFL